MHLSPSPEEPWYLGDPEIADISYPTPEGIDEGNERLSRLPLEKQMAKNAIITAWEMGAPATHAVHMLIENGLFDFERVMWMIAEQARAEAIIEGDG